MEYDQYCERCGEKLNPKTSVALELDTLTSRYHEEGKFPADGLSQGWFFFGKACAKAVIAKGGQIGQTIGKRAPANRPKVRR